MNYKQHNSMEIINVGEEQKEIWNKFIAENNSESFLQSWEWGEFQSKIGRKVWRIGIANDDLSDENRTKVSSIKYQVSSDNLVVVALIVKHDLPFGQSYLYCPRGPVIEKSKIKNQKSKFFDVLFDEIKKITEEEKSLFLKIDPPIKMNQESGIRNHEYFTNFKKSSSEIQPRDTLILDITKSEEELLKDMKQKTRYNIRLAGKKELRITNYELRTDNKKVFKEKFEKFWDLIKETSRRDKFVSHSKDYYWKMFESLNNNYSKNVILRRNDEESRSYTHKTVVQNYTVLNSGSFDSLSLAQDDSTRIGNNSNLIARLYLAEYDNKIIAANLVLFFGDMAVYLHGASSNEYRNVMAPYSLQWRQILDAKEAGCKKYDFWGVSATVRQAHHDIHRQAHCDNGVILSLSKDKKDTWSGITRFKKGFGGYEKNYIGAYDLIFSNIGYRIYGFLKRIKDIVT
ncbi:peptidoglycan bridge formation glycyltransferase FemA/FemB family protein [Candidatus Parcubacteria bacterium]|nr:peptidoglycan bridge formation glycyltransferase FemA/FemB family protein [Candidatus Parcubacteria bacterium]